MLRRPAAAMLVAAALWGCGGDDEKASETTPKAPELTVPQTDTDSTETAPAGTAPPRTGPAPQAPPQTGGGGAPAPQQPPAQGQPPDSPENDQPPPRGSPAERFEKFCEENPGACG